MFLPLFLVGTLALLTYTAKASQVVQPQEINNGLQSKNFWWMEENSPLKKSYDLFKRCASGDCGGPASFDDIGPIQVDNNVFLAGSASEPADSTQEAVAVEAGSRPKPKACPYLSVVPLLALAYILSVHGHSKHDILGSPFSSAYYIFYIKYLNNCSIRSNSLWFSDVHGHFVNNKIVINGGIAAFHSGASFKSNPFFNEKYVSAASGERVLKENGFLGVQPFVPFKNLKNRPSTYKSTTVLGQVNGECTEVGKVCALKSACINGVVTNAEGIARKNAQICNNDEVCCNLPGKSNIHSSINGLTAFTPGKSSFPEKLGGSFEANQGGIHLNFIGQSGVPSVTAKPVRDLSGSNSGGFQFSSTPDYSNVNFDSNVRFNSNFEGEDYLPPVDVSCPTGTFKTASGRCEAVRKECPLGSRQTPSGGCEVIPSPPPRPRCGPGQKEGPYGGCIDITTRPSPPPRPICGLHEILSPSGQCIARPTPPTTCGFGQRLGPNGQCINIETIPPTTSRPTCPPGTQPGPYGSCDSITTRPPPTTPRPTCPPGQKPGPYGGCIEIPTSPPTTTTRPTCPPGQRPGPYGGCVDIATRPPPTTARPTCPPGQQPGSYGGCIDITTRPPPTTARPTCSPGQRPGPYGGCIDIATRPPPTTARPTCPSGQRPGPYGGCIDIATRPPPTTARPTCPPGQQPGPYGGCIDIATRPPPTTARPTCPPGQQPGPYGGCIDIATRPPPTTAKPTCPPGQRPGPYGGCIDVATRPPPTTARPTCPTGQRPGPYGGCVDIATRPPPTTARPTCPPGKRPGPYGGCVDIEIRPPPTTARPTCLPGQKLGPYGGCVEISTRPPSTTARPTCPPGTKPGPYGSCVQIPTRPPPPPSTTGYEYPKPTCPTGQNLGAFGQCERLPPPPTTSRPTCPPGQKLGYNGECIQIVTISPTTPRATCPPGQKPGPYGGGCIEITYRPPTTARPTCPPGKQPGPYGGCVEIATRPPPTTSRPTCPLGQRPGPYGDCVAVPTQPPPTTRPPPPPTTPGYQYPKPTCPPGYKLGSLGQCELIVTQPPPTTPRPTCPSGQKPGPYGGCIEIATRPPPTTVRTCGPNQYLGNNGQCIAIQTQPPTTKRPVCPPGTQFGPYGSCITISTRPPPTTHLVTGPQPTTPRPTCRPGTQPGPYGSCVDVTRPPRPTCPPGSFPTLSGGCQIPTTKRPTTEYPKLCPPGYIKTPTGQCEPPPPPRPICPSGTFLGASGNCERPQPPPTTSASSYLPPKEETTRRPGYQYPVPTPAFEDGRTEDDTPDRNPDGSKTNIYVVSPPTSPKPSQPTRPRPTSQSRIPTKPTSPSRPEQPEYGSGSEIDETQIPVGCAAAMKCVQQIYCSPQGTISATPVILSKEQELFRVPTTVCREVESGSLGVCCRDSKYEDPWPSANLKNGIDDGQYAEDDSIGQYKESYNRIERSTKSTTVRNIVIKRSLVKKMSKSKRSKRNVDECGVRHYNTKPPGERPIDTNFAEIPWQAMILRDSNRSLLCGGVILRRNAVLTAAHCVHGLETSDVLVKGGEWKLGIDEEPLPFQIIKVEAIIRHPDWEPLDTFVNDLAILYLAENFRFTKNVAQICLPKPNQIPTQNCISTGWGKRILQLHARGALMHKINVNIMDNNQCKEMLAEHFPNSAQNYSPNTLCGFSEIDACRVDYGSALACADDSGYYSLSGVYGWDTGCRQQGQIAGFVAPDVDWINYMLEKPLKELRRLDREWRSRFLS